MLGLTQADSEQRVMLPHPKQEDLTQARNIEAMERPFPREFLYDLHGSMCLS